MEDVLLVVEGMTCGGCVALVKRALEGVDGVKAAEVTLEPPQAVVSPESAASVTVDALVSAVDAVGKKAYLPREPVADIVLAVEGMTCGSCVGLIKRTLEGVDGVKAASVTLEPPLAVVSPSAANSVTVDALVSAVSAVGKKAYLPGEEAPDIVLTVGGMTCGSCVKLIKTTLERVSGVACAQVTLDPPQAVITPSSPSLTADALVAAVRRAGKSAHASSAAASAVADDPADAAPEPCAERVLAVGGMTCGSCVARVRDALAGVPGVASAEVTLRPPQARVVCAPRVAVAALVAAVAAVGKTASAAVGKTASAAAGVVAPPQPAIARADAHAPVRGGKGGVASPQPARDAAVVLAVRGMTCSSCVGIVERVLVSLPHVRAARVNLLAARATVDVEEPVKEGDAERLAEAVRAAGYQSEVLEDGLRPASDSSTPRVVSVVCADSARAARVAELLRSVREACGIDGVAVAGPSSRFVRVSLVAGQTLVPLVRSLEDAPAAVVGPFSVGKVNAESSAPGPSFDEEGSSAVMMGSTSGQQSCVDACSTGGLGNVDDEAAVFRSRCLLAISFSLPIMFLNMIGLPRLHFPRLPTYWLMLLLATPVQFICGRGFYRASYFALRKRRATMDVLIALSTSIAYGTSTLVVLAATVGAITHESTTSHARGIGKTPMFNVSAMIISLVLVGKWLESVAKRRAAAGVASLAALAPKEATLYDVDNRRVLRSRVPVSVLRVGDVVRVGAGERVPVDAIVVEGSSAVNESMLTGESSPVTKEAGDFVYGGTTNGMISTGTLIIRTSAVEGDAVLAQIVKLVDDAQTSRAPIEAYADKVSAVFVPAVVSLSFTVFLVWFVLAQANAIPIGWFDSEGAFTFALLFALETMVIACPCALGLATPTAVMVASEVSTKLGILFRGGGAALEAAERIETVLFDKTGTLTMGAPTVSAVVGGTQAHSEPASEVSRLVSAIVEVVEAESRHPLASAIVDYVSAERTPDINLNAFRISDSEELPGRGMQASINDGEYKVRVGSRSWALDSRDAKLLTDSQLALVDRLERDDGLTLVAAVVNNTYAVIFGLEDTVRPEACDVVSYLQNELGVRCALVTGDSEETARAVARKVGIPPSRVTARAMPWTKVDAVKSLPAGTVCFVGDGINDAPALAAADVSIAIGAGAPVAAESASVVLVRSDLNGVVQTLDLARTSFRRVRLNFLWAIGYNVLGIPLAAGALYPFFRIRVPPILASALMAVSSSCVIASSMALRLYRPPKLDAWKNAYAPTSPRSDSSGAMHAMGGETTRRDAGPTYILVDSEQEPTSPPVAFSPNNRDVSATPVHSSSRGAFSLV